MTQEKKKKVIMAIIGCASMGSLMGCGSNDNSIEEDGAKNSASSKNADSAVEIVKNEKLAVDQNKCIGCGKCPRIASANFEMNSRKAEVISQEITSQKDIDRAVSACPTNAIYQ